VINTNLHVAPILHHFGDIAVQNRYIRLPLVFNSPDGGVPLGRCP